uniref:Serine protease 57 n=1 Tax=Accipiter nisus TaxID=211598 RepID=A0A8B9MDH8_9AVES
MQPFLHPRGDGSRIIGGKAAAPHSWPFIASIQMDGEHICGGFLVWPMWVMTAAHCLLNRSAALNEYVKLAHLPSPRVDLSPGTVCHVAGWGDISSSGDQPAELMETSTTIAKRSLCRTLWRGRVSTNIALPAPCPPAIPLREGDSGGPLVFNKKVYGIVSFSGKRCGDRRYPDIYTKVSNYIDWAHRIVQRQHHQKGQPKP